MLVGLLLPRIGSVFQPFVLYLMMLLLFLSFLTIKMDTIYVTLKTAVGTIALLAVVKTVALPIGLYLLFKVMCPPMPLQHCFSPAFRQAWWRLSFQKPPSQQCTIFPFSVSYSH